RLLALLALAFRSHQFYFSHAYDVTQTLQTLRVSSSSSSSSSTTPPPSPEQSSAASFSGGALSSGSGARKAKTKQRPDKASKVQQKKKRRTGAGRTATAGPCADDDGRWRNGGAAAAAQRQGPSGTPPPAVAPPPDERFFWNLGVLEPLLELREKLGGRQNSGSDGGGGGAAVAAVDRWLTPVMSGFLQVERGCRAGERSFDVMFVSRRSRLRQGTRYTRRGIDDVGNVANFVETEQSLLHEDRSVTSHVQIRGSIPVFWSSPTNLRYHPKVRIDPNQEASLRALRRHSEDLIRLYGKNGGGVVFINLVDKKKDQGALGEAFGAALKAVEDGDGGAQDVADEDNASSPGSGSAAGGRGDAGGAAAAAATAAAAPNLAGSLRHVWFDFHHEVCARRFG
ncbi:unnamed protein product, partial [Ectocarpus fasciculatus]